MLDRLRGVNADFLAILAQSFKFYDTVDLGEDGVVSTQTHIRTRVDLGPSLAYQDIARLHTLPGKSLNT